MQLDNLWNKIWILVQISSLSIFAIFPITRNGNVRKLIYSVSVQLSHNSFTKEREFIGMERLFPSLVTPNGTS